MKLSVLLAGVLAVLTSLNAQTSGPNAQTAQPNPIPSSQVQFDTGNGTQISLPSLAITQLPVCYSADSCSADFAPVTGDFLHELVGHFDLAGDIHAINPAAIQNLSHVQVVYSTPTNDGVAVLVSGAVSGDAYRLRLVPKSGTEPNPSGLHGGFYVCFFDGDGQPQGVQKIDPRYRPAKIAYLEDDEVLLLLFDTINERPALAAMKSDGQIVRFLDTQGLLPSAEDLLESSAAYGVKSGGNAADFMKQIAMTAALSGWQIGYAAKRLLLLQPGTKPIIWSISPGGEVRRVNLKMPPGTTAGSILSSDRNWLVRSFVLPTPSQKEIILEFDPESGTVLRQIYTSPAPPDSVLYAGQGHYYAFWRDKDKHPRILESK